jgi:hypothetical protein
MWLSLLLTVALWTQDISSLAVTSWAWFHTTSTANTWSIDQGRADVAITDHQFKATLWDGDEKKFARLSLDGTITGAVVNVKITVNNSDLEPYHVRGTLTRTCYEGGGRESIILSTGFDVIGLVHEIRGACRNIPADRK